MGQSVWAVRTTETAKLDFKNILRWTADRFGTTQAKAYAETVTLALEALCAGPQVVGGKLRVDIAPDIYTLHVGRKGRQGRHFLMFRIGLTGQADEQPVIEVLRILHDSMDLKRHLPPS